MNADPKGTWEREVRRAAIPYTETGRIIPCPVCSEPSRILWTWRGYTRMRCVYGHKWRMATAKQAAKNLARLSA